MFFILIYNKYSFVWFFSFTKILIKKILAKIGEKHFYNGKPIFYALLINENKQNKKIAKKLNPK